MAASDYVPIFFKNRLHLAGRPQMSTRPGGAAMASLMGTSATGNARRGSDVQRRESRRSVTAALGHVLTHPMQQTASADSITLSAQ
jgi:hypothetical protein